MMEISVILGLIIIITIVIMYNRHRQLKQCDQYVQYFDKVYYDVPTLNTLSEDSVNDRVDNNRLRPIFINETDQQSSRWAGSVTSQPITEDGHINFTNTDRVTEPMENSLVSYNVRDLTNQVKSVYSKMGRESMTDGFMDDTRFDPQFSLNERYGGSI